MARARDIGSSDAMASAIVNSDHANRVWASGFGLWQDAGASGGDLGFRYDSGGIMAGYDRAFGPVMIGGAFGYTHGSFEDKAALDSDSKIDSYLVNISGTYNHQSGLFAGLMGGYLYTDYDMKSLLTLTGVRQDSGYHANTLSIGAEAGYDWKPVECLVATPTIGIQYHNTRTGRISGVLTSVDRLREDALQLPVDLEVRYDFVTDGDRVIGLKANAGYAYNFKNDGADGTLTYNGVVNSPWVRVEGRRPGRHALNLGGGLKYSAGGFSAVVEYDYYARKDYDAHRVMGTIGVSF